MLTEIQIANLRSFKDLTTISIANNVECNLTVFVGAQNSGKTSILESLDLLRWGSYMTHQPGAIGSTYKIKNNLARFNSTALMVRGKYDDKGEFCLKSLDSSPSDVKVDTSRPITNKTFIVPSERYLSGQINENKVESLNEFYKITPRKGVYENYIRGNSDFEFSKRIHNWLTDNKYLNKLEIVTGDCFDQKFIKSSENKLLVKRDESSHEVEGLGYGMVNICCIIDALESANRGDLIVIDEPEKSLQPGLQLRLLDLIKSYSSDKQVIIFTHSPFFIDWDAICNKGAILNKVWNEKGISKVGTLDSSIPKIKSFLADINNPHILGIDATSTLFMSDGIVLLEGQEDAVILKRKLSETNKNLSEQIWGFGSGGANNIPFITQTLSELKYNKIYSIIDGDSEGDIVWDKINNEQQIEKNEHGYRFSNKTFQISKPNIRDKHNKDGLFDSKGNLKAESENEFEEITNWLQQIS